MKRVETVLAQLMPDIAGKRVLEPACGCAEFSIAAAKYAQEVVCFDLDDKRMDPDVFRMSNLRFEIMDAAHMRYRDSSFDTVVLYNAIGHLSHMAEPVLRECHRVAGERGIVCIVSSFRMDKAVIQETVLPLLVQMGLPFVTENYKDFEYVRIGRKTEHD